MTLLLIALTLGLNASIFMRIDRILHNSFATVWGNSGSHTFSVNTDYQLIYIKRILYNMNRLATMGQIGEPMTVPCTCL